MSTFFRTSSALFLGIILIFSDSSIAYGQSGSNSSRSAQRSSSDSKAQNKNKSKDKPKEDKKRTAPAAPSAEVNTFAPSVQPSEDELTETVQNPEDAETLKQQGTDIAPDYKENQGEGRMEIDPTLLKQSRSDAASEAYATTRKNARTMALLIPPPRGQIVDRHGLPLAQNKIAYQIALKFGQFEKEDKETILAYGRKCIADAEKIAGTTWSFSDEQLWSHYQHRRWLPLPLTNNLKDDIIEGLKGKLPSGLELLPIYTRFYPNGNSAAHMLGYVGSKGKLPRGPINHMDPLWEIPVGRSGFESYFDKPLTGRPGVWRLMFDEEGNKILDELSIKPKQGGTVVTTIDYKWQKAAEEVLAKQCKRGAIVVLDIVTGEVLVLASQPSFDPNKFVPNISEADYKALREDPNNPLVSRAFQGVYPPASTYKTVVGLAALANGTITEGTIINCPASITVGNHTFKNWTTNPEGPINVCRALARSCNTFFYQLAQRMGATPFLSLSRTLGMGQRTGLPIQDQPGLIPDDEWLRKTNRRKFYDGDALNFSIGQGVVMTTPLQVAQFMAAIADGTALLKLHLIKQIHDMDGNVIYEANREVRTSLAGLEPYCAIIRKGMYDVVNSSGGTGARVKLSFTSIAGKTGTGQWGSEKEDKRVGWFAGFLPYENPRYAFAALYEGRPHEKVGGSSNGVPLIKSFFEAVKDDVKNALNPPVAEIVEDESTHQGATDPHTPNTPTDPNAPTGANVNADGAPVLPNIDSNSNNSNEPAVLPEILEIDDSSNDQGQNAKEVEVISPEGAPQGLQPQNEGIPEQEEDFDAITPPPVDNSIPVQNQGQVEAVEVIEDA